MIRRCRYPRRNTRAQTLRQPARPGRKLALDIGRQPLDADQLATEFFETVVIKTEVEPDTAIGNAAFRDEAPEDLFQDLIKVHASALVRHDLRRSLMSCPRFPSPASNVGAARAVTLR